MTIFHRAIPSPVGPLRIAASDAGLHGIEFPGNRHPVKQPTPWEACDHPLLHETQAQLDAYFGGRLKVFHLPLAPRGTAFQEQVWMMLAAIPYGRTWSYRELASALGKPTATRAVGAANGRNPLPIVLPCHRVIGANGDLTGFGGGLPTKHFLLRLEDALPAARASAR